MTTTIPSEFVGFVRETGVRALDRLSTRARDLDPPLRNFLRSWGRLSEGDKYRLFEELIDTVRRPEGEDPAAPPARMKQKRSVKRYDPEEVAATLPKKPRPRRKTTSKKK